MFETLCIIFKIKTKIIFIILFILNIIYISLEIYQHSLQQNQINLKVTMNKTTEAITIDAIINPP